MFLWICFITFAHAAMLGGGLLSKEERDKTAEFLNTKPIDRGEILMGKIIAGFVNIFVVNILCYATTLFCFLPLVKGANLTREVSLSMLGMLIGQILMLLSGICLSTLVRNYRKAGIYSAFMIVGMYLLSVMIEMAEFDKLNFLTPFRAFNAADIIESGLNISYTIIALFASAGMGIISYIKYKSRNIEI